MFFKGRNWAHTQAVSGHCYSPGTEQPWMCLILPEILRGNTCCSSCISCSLLTDQVTHSSFIPFIWLASYLDVWLMLVGYSMGNAIWRQLKAMLLRLEAGSGATLLCSNVSSPPTCCSVEISWLLKFHASAFPLCKMRLQWGLYKLIHTKHQC